MIGRCRYRGVHQVPYVAGATKHDFALRAIQASSTSGGFASLWPWGKSRTAATAGELGGGASRRCAGGRGENQGRILRVRRPARIRPKAPESSASDTKSSTKEATKKTEEATSKESAAKGSDQPASPSRHREYPGWLAAGWDTYQEWWNLGDFRAAPRVFRRLGAMLLRAERRWRGGDDQREVRAELKSELQARVQDMKRAKQIQLPIAALGRFGSCLGPAPRCQSQTGNGGRTRQVARDQSQRPQGTGSEVGNREGAGRSAQGENSDRICLGPGCGVPEKTARPSHLHVPRFDRRPKPDRL